MLSGVVCDIKEFAVHDGPGIRTTVFLKGRPLACCWCHNPEGRSPKPQILSSPTGTRTVGQRYASETLAARLNEQAAILRANEGGVTFSGGEPLLQPHFVAEVIDRLNDIHVLLDTSGYASESRFKLVSSRCDLVHYDLKFVDRDLHFRYTGVTNDMIIHSLHVLSEMGTPFVVRVPLIPGVTDTDENLSAIATAVDGLPALMRVDLLPYSKTAGGKYQAAGMEFQPDYDESRPLNINTMFFESRGIPVEVRQRRTTSKIGSAQKDGRGNLGEHSGGTGKGISVAIAPTQPALSQ